MADSQQQQWYGGAPQGPGTQGWAPAAAQPMASNGGMANYGGGGNGGWAPPQMGGGMGGGMDGGVMNSSTIGSGAIGGGAPDDEEDYTNEPPLLVELGIDFGDIWVRTKSVLNPKRSLQDMSLDEADLAGPIMFALALASVLILHGKLAFGAIYGAFLMGCFAVYIVMSLLSQKKEIGFFPVVSIMGYGLLPIIVLATLAIIVSMRGYFGLVCGGTAMAWSTYTSSRFFEKAMEMYEHRLIIAYPVGLFYASFILLTIF